MHELPVLINIQLCECSRPCDHFSLHFHRQLSSPSHLRWDGGMGFLRQHRCRLTYPSTAGAAPRTPVSTDNDSADYIRYRWYSSHRTKRNVCPHSERSPCNSSAGGLDDRCSAFEIKQKVARRICLMHQVEILNAQRRNWSSMGVTPDMTPCRSEGICASNLAKTCLHTQRT